jgi:hypothetical protein
MRTERTRTSRSGLITNLINKPNNKKTIEKLQKVQLFR